MQVATTVLQASKGLPAVGREIAEVLADIELHMSNLSSV
jgi:hypothetical protein